ncbi:MAG: ABC-F family ATP-binding cassette domain-containing protein [Bacteroidetes bacterium]|jgi:ATP-binding cassette subfamily F protein 3|nr:ABC-F family ATP-binding cassette domain-containing protein [Bacteroidota bacterium]MDF1865750.1 ABC-F family ATP-binding cassette domain-containing protein [Saprospiraceae bacterium]
MITASNIFVKYGDRILLDSIDLVIGVKDKVGLIGRNGAGKSTLLKIIAKEITPDDGNITMPTESTVGFLHQEMELPKGKTVIDETMTAFDGTKKIERRIEEINIELGVRTDYESDAYSKLLIEFSDLNDRFSLLGGDNMEADAEKVLKGLGFKNSDFSRLTDEFSGGWQMRIELAKMLLQRPNYLFLDEPTNHLDIESIIWLEQFLKTYPGAVLTISHDKTFLNNVTNRTIEIELGQMFDYKAPYSKAMEMRAERREKTMSAFQNQQKVIAQRERTITRFMAKATKTKMAQSMKKQLDKIERIEIQDEDLATMNIRFPKAPRSGDVVLEGKNLVKSYGSLNVLNKVGIKLDRGDRVAFVGQNGQGKTTLAKIIVNELGLTDGEMKLGHNVQLGYYAQNQSDTLYPKSTLLETMEAHSPPEMRTRLRKILGAFMFSGEDADKKVSVLSGGERARLALACMLLNPFNLLVLDEPTNHLDMLSKEVLKQALVEYDGTIIVVSHDRDFLAGLTNRTIEFRDKKLHDHLGDVNYFLKKRAMDNMREVELSTPKVKETPKENKPELSYDERKKLLRAVSLAEKKIEKLETKIADFEKTMGKSDFFQSPDQQTVINKYNEAKTNLDSAMEEWEKAQLMIEEAGA